MYAATSAFTCYGDHRLFAGPLARVECETFAVSSTANAVDDRSPPPLPFSVDRGGQSENFHDRSCFFLPGLFQPAPTADSPALP